MAYRVEARTGVIVESVAAARAKISEHSELSHTDVIVTDFHGTILDLCTPQPEADLANLSHRARTALRGALAGRPASLENIIALSQRDIRVQPSVGLITLKEIIRWAARHGIDLPRW